MIDFHNHVLSDVDDGPKIIEESMSMLRKASNQGITDIVQTVHFQHPKMDNKNVDYNYLNSRIKELQYLIDKENLNIKMHLAAEVFYLPNLVDISKNPLVTCGNGKYMLIEFATNIFPSGYQNEFFKLQNLDINPIVAHPERYRFIQNDLTILEDWINKKYIIQIDAGSLIGQFGPKIKQLVFKMIDNGYVHLLGSDAHNDKKRNFCLKEAYDVLDNKYSKKIVDDLMENSLKILLGEKVQSIAVAKNKTSSLFKKIFKFRS